MNQKKLSQFALHFLMLLPSLTYGMEELELSFPILSHLTLEPKGLGEGVGMGLRTLSPQVHDFTRKCTLQDLKKVHYDITTFKVQISFDQGDEQAIVKNILEMNLLRKHLGYVDSLCKWTALKRAFIVFQRAEAKAVFYRDINGILDENLNLIKDDEDFKKVRASNSMLITRCFDKTEPIRDSLYQLLRADQAVCLFEHFLGPYSFCGSIENKQELISTYKEAMKKNNLIKGGRILFSLTFVPLVELPDDLLEDIDEIK